MELCLDDEQLEATKEADWWFEEEPHSPNDNSFSSPGACKWYVVSRTSHHVMS